MIKLFTSSLIISILLIGCICGLSVVILAIGAVIGYIISNKKTNTENILIHTSFVISIYAAVMTVLYVSK
jgi:hypothetical protein